MNHILRLNALILLTAILFGCNKDFLDRRPLGEVSSADVWKDGPLSEAFITNIYGGLGLGGFNEQMLASLSDEAIFTHADRNINTINEGSASPTNPGWVNSTYEWTSMYNWIRTCNVALVELESATFDDPELLERLKGETYFLRAYFYHQLVRYYGGVPLVDKVYGLNEDYSIDRSSFADCIDFILNDLQQAYTLLDGKSVPKGRASAIAVLALKSRVLLYAASDLHDIPTAGANSSVISGYGNKSLIGYESGDRIARWTAAKNAAKAVMDAAAGYMLDLSAAVTPEEGRLNYKSIAMGGGSSGPGINAAAAIEILFGRYFVPEKNEDAGWHGRHNGPNGYANWAGNTPIGLFVDAYEVLEGGNTVPFNWSNPVHKANPYINRDPRMYATILYDGAQWKPRPNSTLDPVSQIQTGAYDIIQNGNLTTWQGLDTRSSPIEDWNGSRTGYYFVKFIDINPAQVDQSMLQYIPWPFFRYTEAVLNYVEACIELNEDGEAVSWLNKIRYRSGLPAIEETSGTALKERYRHERAIELAFEEHRYHDARRWMIAPTTLGRKVTYISVTGKFKPGKQQNAPYTHDESIYDYTYLPVENNAHENRKWDDKMYYVPIHRDEMNRNSKLVQNPGY
ncbi:MAG: RagB/SusD family nutrient uptake outer membrane protein [Chitinophagaceae bacterium]|nr:RagB/SusD family nutrient uptake outer membrane protein [Chitinophagaceae bacterium]